MRKADLNVGDILWFPNGDGKDLYTIVERNGDKRWALVRSPRYELKTYTIGTVNYACEIYPYELTDEESRNYALAMMGLLDE